MVVWSGLNNKTFKDWNALPPSTLFARRHFFNVELIKSWTADQIFQGLSKNSFEPGDGGQGEALLVVARDGHGSDGLVGAKPEKQI